MAIKTIGYRQPKATCFATREEAAAALAEYRMTYRLHPSQQGEIREYRNEGFFVFVPGFGWLKRI